MRTLHYLLIACALVTLSSCEDDNTEPTPAPKTEFQITSENPMEFSAEGGECTIKYEIINPKEGAQVTATTEAEWIVASDATYAGQNEIFFNVLPNEVTESRTATIVVTYDTFTVDVIVNQSAAEPKLEVQFEIVSDNPMEFSAEGGECTIKYEITNPKEGAQVAATTEAEWIVASDATYAGQNEIFFNVLPNEVAEPRTATIVVTYDTFTVDVIVNQAAATEPQPHPEGNKLPYLSGTYFGNSYGATENDHNYSIILSTMENCLDIVTGESLIYANNTYLFLDLYASEPSENYNISFTVPMGEYTFDLENSAVAGTIGAEYTYLYEAGDEQGVETHFVSGKVVVDEARIDAMFVDESGVEHHFYTENVSVDNSDLFVGNGMYGEFSTLEGDLNIDFSIGSIYGECYGDYYVVGKNTWLLYIDDYATGESLMLEVLAPLSDEFPVGEFQVSTDLSLERMVLPGYVGSDGNTLWSWYRLYDESGYNIVGEAPIKSGKLTIVDNGDDTCTATIDFVDDLGNKITGECVANFESYGAMACAARSTRTLKPARNK